MWDLGSQVIPLIRARLLLIQWGQITRHSHNQQKQAAETSFLRSVSPTPLPLAPSYRTGYDQAFSSYRIIRFCSLGLSRHNRKSSSHTLAHSQDTGVAATHLTLLWNHTACHCVRNCFWWGQGTCSHVCACESSEDELFLRCFPLCFCQIWSLTETWGSPTD